MLAACRRLGAVPFAVMASVFVAVLFLLSSAGVAWSGPAPGHAAPRPGIIPPAHPAVAVAEARGVVPASGGVNGSFFSSNSAVALTPANQTVCIPSFFRICYPQSQNPSVVALANGHVGLAFSTVTNYSTSPCKGAANNTTTRIAFADSADNGSTFSSFHFVGDSTSASCPYFNGLEPSFTSGAKGEVFGAFVETNASANATMGTGWSTNPSMPIAPYTARSGDALAFVNSTDNGTTFTSGKVLVKGDVAHPAIAAFQRSVYIVYENISNGTTTLPGTGANPIAIELVYSTDTGASWSGPITLPGLGSGVNLTSLSPSIAVNATGTIAVAYATDRSCVAWCGGGYTKYGYEVVVATSTTNGSTWSRPHVAGPVVGETLSPYGISLPALFEGAPTTTVAFGGITGALYVAWAGTYNQSAQDQWPYFTDWTRVTVFSSASSNNGVAWSPPVMIPPLLRAIGDFSQQFGEGNFNPSLGVSGGTAYLTYSYFSWTNGACGFGTFGTNYFGQAFAQYLSKSPDGQHWTPAGILFGSTRSAGLAFYHYAGSQASVGFARSGAPVVAYAVPDGWFLFQGSNVNMVVTLSVSSPYLGPTTSLTIDRTGLPSGTSWTANVDGVTFGSTAANLTINNVPANAVVYLLWTDAPLSAGYRTLVEPLISMGPLLTLSGPTTVYYNFTEFYGLTFNVQPTNVPSFQIQLSSYGGTNPYHFYYSWQTQYSVFAGTSYYYFGGCAFPWFFPKGALISVSNQFTYPNSAYYFSAALIDYWNGTGAGSYTGSGLQGNLTVSSAFNETLWMGGGGTFSATFQPLGLPASSVYNFHLDGLPHGALGTSPLTVANLTTGAHWLTGVVANSSTPGWKYFGSSSVGNPVIVPEETQVNLSFALVNLSAAPGVVSFHAVGIGSGTPWRLSFNGTLYGSQTPWINVTTRPGTFPIAGFPAVAANTSASYAPLGLGSNISVSAGGSYPINFQPAYRLDVLSATGGTVSPAPGSFWVAPGSSRWFNATVAPGYAWGGWAGTGTGSYSGSNLTAHLVAGGPISEAATFFPLPTARFNLTVQETGLPAGTLWTLYLDGQGYSSTNSSFVVPNLYSCAISGSRGNYVLVAPFVYQGGLGALTRYVPSSYPSTVCAPGSVSVTFSPEFYLTVEAGVGGTAQATIGASPPGGSGWVSNGTSVALSESPANGYSFAGWVGSGPGSYSGTSATPSLTLLGPVSEVATFAANVKAPTPQYTVAFQAVGTSFAPGTSWTIRLGSTNYSSDTASLVVPNLPTGSYPLTVQTALAPDHLTEYTPHAAPARVDVTQNRTLNLTFAPSFWVAVNAVGPGTATPSSGWVALGGSVSLLATPGTDAVFLGWAGTGASSYAGSALQWNLSATAPVTETATFAASSPAVAAGSSSWSSPVVWIALGLVGLVVGVAAGVLVMRGRRGAGEPASPPPEAEPAAPEEGT